MVDAGWAALAGAAAAAGVGAEAGAWVAPAAAGAGFVAADPAVAVGRAGVLRAGVAFLVTGVVLRAGPDGATAFGAPGLAGATGAAVALVVVVFLVTILLSSAMGEKIPPNYDARPVSG